MPNTETDRVIQGHQVTHGDFVDTARVAQRLKLIIQDEMIIRVKRGQSALTYTQVESLDLIMTKIARMISGDADFPDHVLDIAGYAMLANKE